MLKKITFLTMIVISVLVFFITSYAFDTKDKAKNEGFEKKLINITKPKKYEIVFSKKYVICGITSFENIRLKFMVYDEKSKNYLKRDDFKVKSPGIMLKQIDLPKYGINKVKIVTFYDNNGKKEVQTDKFVITTLDKKMKNILKQGSRNLLDSTWDIR